MLPRHVVLIYRGLGLIEVTFAVTAFLGGQWFQGASALIIGMVMASWATAYRKAYKWGWVAGRNEQLRSIDEAYHRGIPHADWMAAELERNVVALLTHLKMEGEK